eukprot:c13155_g5_i1.p1 GENE.c13155_g5_i1~~c13155_g5_i1.p1  ORF type:complete len:215 (+),score=56.82 c13155_g5_i1:223-867(+)
MTAPKTSLNNNITHSTSSSKTNFFASHSHTNYTTLDKPTTNNNSSNTDNDNESENGFSPSSFRAKPGQTLFAFLFLALGIVEIRMYVVTKHSECVRPLGSWVLAIGVWHLVCFVSSFNSAEGSKGALSLSLAIACVVLTALGGNYVYSMSPQQNQNQDQDQMRYSCPMRLYEYVWWLVTCHIVLLSVGVFFILLIRVWKALRKPHVTLLGHNTP